MPGHRVPFVPVDHDPPVDRPTEEYPIRLTTGRGLDSYNTGSRPPITPRRAGQAGRTTGRPSSRAAAASGSS